MTKKPALSVLTHMYHYITSGGSKSFITLSFEFSSFVKVSKGMIRCSLTVIFVDVEQMWLHD